MKPRRVVVALWLALVVLLLPVREAMSPDESRFIQQAQEMRTSGDWIVPTIGGVDNTEKPPGLFWAINAAAWWQARIGEGAARLPSALAALAVVLLAMRTARRLWGGSRGVVVEDLAFGGALVLLTDSSFFHRAQWISTDMPLTALVWAALVAWREALFDSEPGERPARLGMALGGLAVGLGVMVKGPVSLVWPLLWIAAEALVRRRGRPLLALLRPEVLAGVFGPVALWLWAFARQAGWEAFLDATLYQALSRFHNPPNLVKPWHFFLHQLPVDLLPWTPFVPLVLALGWQAWRARTPAGAEDDARAVRILALFALLAFVFFSASKGKRDVYLLPLHPVLALLVARAALDLRTPLDRSPRARRIAYLALGALGLLAAVVLPAVVVAGDVRGVAAMVARVGTDWLAPVAFGGVALVAAALFARWLLLRAGDSVRALQVAAGGAAALLFALGLFVGLAANRHQGARAFGAQLARVVPEGERIAIERGKFEMFLYYSGRAGSEAEDLPELLDLLAHGGCRFALMDRARYDAARGSEPRLAALTVVHAGPMSGREWVVLGVGNNK